MTILASSQLIINLTQISQTCLILNNWCEFQLSEILNVLHKQQQQWCWRYIWYICIQLFDIKNSVSPISSIKRVTIRMLSTQYQFILWTGENILPHQSRIACSLYVGVDYMWEFVIYTTSTCHIYIYIYIYYNQFVKQKIRWGLYTKYTSAKSCKN